MSEFAIHWLSRAESLALGWTLLHFVWQGAAIALVFVLADRLTRRATSSIRYAVALGALALMPFFAAATFIHEIRILTPVRAVRTIQYELPRIVGPGTDRAITISAPESFATIPPLARQGTSWLQSHAEQILPWVDGVWILGVLLLAIRTIGGWRQLEQLRRSASGIVPAQVEQLLLRVAERVNVGGRVVVRVSDQVISPMVMGIWRATVILPMSAVLRLNMEELEAVLAHELGHIRRWDYACNLVQTALETVLFFHPAVWWLSRAVRDRREVCCDEIALHSGADPVVYAQTLLRLEEQKITDLQIAVALRGTSGSLLARIEKVLGGDGPMESRITGSVRLAVAGAVVIGLLLGPKVSDAVAAARPILNHVQSADPAPAAQPQESPTPKPRPGKAEAVIVSDAQSDAKVTDLAPVEPDNEVAAEPAGMQSDSKPGTKGISYIDGMRDAGYPLDLNNDLNALISMKSVGVTPEYAKAMANLGFGKPGVHELISLKALGVTPEYVAELKASGLGPKDFHEVTTEKALGITPEYSAEMKKVGFTNLGLHDLISLKAQGVSPEYVGWLKQQFPQITMDQLRQASVFHLDEKFLAAAKSHGFDGRDLEKLLRLKISGLLDE